MAFWYNKPGQGYWTRTLSLLGAMVLIVVGALWIRSQLAVFASHSDYAVYIQWGVAAALILILGGAMIWILNKPRIVEFMIATEAEMRKVNWPTRRDIIGSTWIVICGTLLMAALLGVVDVVFFWVFQRIGVLAGG
ncbi:MAG: preprotein translocase subunit SecE [Phycisphaeraceae bacterium]